MKLIAALLLLPGFFLFTGSVPALAQEQEQKQEKYEQPYPHATGAQLLPYCQPTAIVVDQLRCDYYMQALADLASTPVQGSRPACPPRGTNRTELMAFAAEYLAALPPDQLENSSAASLLLQGMQKKFRCPKTGAKKGVKSAGPKMKSAIKRAMNKQTAGDENTEKQ